jgi:hypothetical protein
VTDPGHLHSQGLVTSTPAGFPTTTGGSNTSGNTATAVTGITVANSTEGVSGTNANLPPYLGINFIIKT